MSLAERGYLRLLKKSIKGGLLVHTIFHAILNRLIYLDTSFLIDLIHNLLSLIQIGLLFLEVAHDLFNVLAMSHLSTMLLRIMLENM